MIDLKKVELEVNVAVNDAVVGMIKNALREILESFDKPHEGNEVDSPQDVEADLDLGYVSAEEEAEALASELAPKESQAVIVRYPKWMKSTETKMAKVYAATYQNPSNVSEIASMTGLTNSEVSRGLERLKQRNSTISNGKGLWRSKR